MTSLTRLAGLALLAITGLAGIQAAQAHPPGFFPGPPRFEHWNDGYWHHGYYHGRLGWWWVAGGAWYWYSAPVYPYPAPDVPPVVIAAPVVTPVPVAPTQVEETASPPPAQVWYYCKAAKQYYPYISECPGGWKTVPAKPPQ
ncbi:MULTISPECIES: hypothetical protein [Aquitalea]|uniref:hypothetical protein n=1 Tax=Aquitalea TaxID=407217 RepID=UPI00135A8E8A|nr:MULTISPECIES: hypothetical protein [Aquitalea]